MDQNDKLPKTTAIINITDWPQSDVYTKIHAADQAQLGESPGCICRLMQEFWLQAWADKRQLSAAAVVILAFILQGCR